MSPETVGGGLTPEGPKGSKIAPALLDEYYDSIKDPFRDTQDGLANESPIGKFVAVFIFCLIPIIPYILSKLAYRAAGDRMLSFRNLHIHLASFWFWWVLSFTISLLLLIIVGKFSGVSAEEKKKWLSASQMRFAYCYGAVHEIRQYKTNQRPWHIDSALDFFDKTGSSLLNSAGLDGSDISDLYSRREILLGRQYANVLLPYLSGSHPKWYRVRPETEAILQAFREFNPKLRDRLKDKKDLAAVEAILTDLAAYQYTEIPELSDTESETRFEEGTEILLSFAEKLATLPPYKSERLAPTPKETLSRRMVLVGRKVSSPFIHENVLVAFCSWLVLMSLLFWGGFFFALRMFPIKIDSTIMTALIGGPVATAVTGATIPRLGKNKKHRA